MKCRIIHNALIQCMYSAAFFFNARKVAANLFSENQGEYNEVS